MNSQELKYLRESIRAHRYYLIDKFTKNTPEPPAVKAARTVLNKHEQEQRVRKNRIYNAVDAFLAEIEMSAILASSPSDCRNLLQRIQDWTPGDA